MATKYIVNNLTGQTIDGDLTINGNIIVTGLTSSNGIGVYKALLTQTGPLSGTNIISFYNGLIIGETYTISNYVTGDSFSNIANVQSGNIDETGCVFIATGNTPSIWTNGSELTSTGDLIVDVLENTLGYDIEWTYNVAGPGIYLGINSVTGPQSNSFPQNKTYVTAQSSPYNNIYGGFYQTFGGVGSFGYINDVVFVVATEYDGGISPLNNTLYYTPVEINVKKDLDTTPIEIYGLNVSSFPYGNVSIRLFADSSNVGIFYGNYVLVNDIDELVVALNNDSNINYLGTFSVNPDVIDGIILTMATNLKNQFSPNNTLTFEAFND